MDRDLKGIIDSVDVKDKTQSVLERKVETLKEEITRLNFTIREQKTLISSLKGSRAGSSSGLEADDDIKFLKDMIFTQRQEILQKDREVDDLKLEIDKYIIRLEKQGLSDDQEKLKEALMEADQRIEQLTENIEQYERNDENAKQIIKQLSREKEASYNEIKMLKRKLTDLEAKDFTYKESVDLQNAKEQIEELKGDIGDFLEQNKDLRQELEDTRKQLSEKNERAEQLKIENEGYHVENDLLKAHLSNMEKKIDESEILGELDLAKETIGKLQDEINNLETKIPALEQELKQSQESSDDISSSASKNVKQLEKERKRYQAEIEKLQEKYQTLEEKFKKKDKKKKKKEESHVEDGQFVTGLLEEADSSKEVIMQSQREIEEYKAQITSLSQELERANETIGELSESSKTQLTQLEKYIQNDQVEKGKLNEKIQNLEDKIKKKDKKKKKGKEDQLEDSEILSIDNQQLEMISKNYELQIKELTQELENAQPKTDTDDNLKQLLDSKLIEELQIELDEYKTTVQNLQHQLERAQGSSENLDIGSEIPGEINKKLLTFEEENKRLQREVTNTNSTVDRLIDEIDGYLKETADQNEEIAQKNSKINALNTKVESLKTDIQQLQEKLSSPLERVEENIQSQTDESTEIIASLRNEKKELTDTISALTEQNLALSNNLSELIEASTGDTERITILEQENQKLNDTILEYKNKESEQPLEIGSIPSFDQPFDDESASIIRDLKNENQNLIQELNEIKSNQATDNDSLKKMEQLTQEIQRLKTEQTTTTMGANITQQDTDVQLNLPKSYQAQLFTSMLENLDIDNKNKVIDTLIQDLKNHENFEVKRNAMSILCHLNSDKVNKAFANLIHDENWLVRFYLVKIVSKTRNPELQKLLKALANDIDIDVREAANRMLSNK